MWTLPPSGIRALAMGDNPPYSYGGTGKADGFNLDVVDLALTGPRTPPGLPATMSSCGWSHAASLGTQRPPARPVISPSARLT